MVRIDCLIFGYRKIQISPEDLSTATSLLLRFGIPSRFNYDGTITIRERDFSRMGNIFRGRVRFSASEVLGLYGKIKSIKHKSAVALGVVCSLIIITVLSGMVWDIRIEGNENIPSSKIKYQLSECGFAIGDFWFLKDRSEIETKFLLNCEDVSWININKRGTVAYIKVIEKNEDNDETEVQQSGYANIVATSDCVIEEITVVSGYAVVKPGDTVKKGDLLISGVLPSEAGGGFCIAEGSVVGRMNDTVSVKVDREYTLKQEKKKKLYSLDINLFNFSINIFKLYGNLTNECDIIEYNKSLSLLNGSKLPCSVTLLYVPQYEFTQSEYTDEQLVSVAVSRLNSATASRLSTCDLVKLKTYGSFTELGYEMSCEIVFLAEVGESLSFEVD